MKKPEFMGADYKRNATAAQVTQMRALLKEEILVPWSNINKIEMKWKTSR